ncbi:YciI family protein [Kitasatospora sp. NBC_01560]|uniref:YciI family protein n=1 Tax=Kitasatospora sp. NBC_01560 TaxID=2975965 RepID=UPI00386A93DF
MKYLVLMYADPAATAAMTAEERADVFRRHEALHRDLDGSGEILNGAGLAYPEDTATLRGTPDGPVTTTDGPLVAATEQLTAYYVLDCETPERARAIAERVVDFHVVAVEVRPIHDSFGMDHDSD